MSEAYFLIPLSSETFASFLGVVTKELVCTKNKETPDIFCYSV